MKRLAARPAFDRQSRAVTAASSDGVVVFKLVACADCVHVERSQWRAGSGRSVQAMRFHDNASFNRWCEADRLSFVYPLLYAGLQRSGRALFSPAP